MNPELLVKQAENFKGKYGELPKLPIRVRYKWATVRAEGDIKPTRFGGYSIFGFPGMVPPTDEEVTNLVMLYDAEKRPFPDIPEEESIGDKIIAKD